MTGNYRAQKNNFEELKPGPLFASAVYKNLMLQEIPPQTAPFQLPKEECLLIFTQFVIKKP